MKRERRSSRSKKEVDYKGFGEEGDESDEDFAQPTPPIAPKAEKKDKLKKTKKSKEKVKRTSPSKRKERLPLDDMLFENDLALALALSKEASGSSPPKEKKSSPVDCMQQKEKLSHNATTVEVQVHIPDLSKETPVLESNLPDLIDVRKDLSKETPVLESNLPDQNDVHITVSEDMPKLAPCTDNDGDMIEVVETIQEESSKSKNKISRSKRKATKEAESKQKRLIDSNGEDEGDDVFNPSELLLEVEHCETAENVQERDEDFEGSPVKKRRNSSGSKKGEKRSKKKKRHSPKKKPSKPSDIPIENKQSKIMPLDPGTKPEQGETLAPQDIPRVPPTDDQDISEIMKLIEEEDAGRRSRTKRKAAKEAESKQKKLIDSDAEDGGDDGGDVEFNADEFTGDVDESDEEIDAKDMDEDFAHSPAKKKRKSSNEKNSDTKSKKREKKTSSTTSSKSKPAQNTDMHKNSPHTPQTQKPPLGPKVTSKGFTPPSSINSKLNPSKSPTLVTPRQIIRKPVATPSTGGLGPNPLGGVRLVSPNPPMRLGLSRFARVRPLHSNVK